MLNQSRKHCPMAWTYSANPSTSRCLLKSCGRSMAPNIATWKRARFSGHTLPSFRVIRSSNPERKSPARIPTLRVERSLPVVGFHQGGRLGQGEVSAPLSRIRAAARHFVLVRPVLRNVNNWSNFWNCAPVFKPMRRHWRRKCGPPTT